MDVSKIPHVELAPIYTVEQFAKRNPAFSNAALRNLIFKADDRESSRGKIQGNGLLAARAIIRCGRKVLIHEARFFLWLENKQPTVDSKCLRNGDAT